MRATNTDLNIEILGINWLSHSNYNYLITAGRSLPWLQDTSVESVWNKWKVALWDVWIVDGQSRLVSIYNLTVHDLSIETNRATLQQLLLSAGNAVDSDGDGLPDDWELQYFGNLSATPASDADGDGVKNATEFAFGTNPTDPKSWVPMQIVRRASDGQKPSFSLSFRRRAGSILDYLVEVSPDLQHWALAGRNVLSVQARRNLFDGTGTSEVTCTVDPAAIQFPVFFRIRAQPRAR